MTQLKELVRETDSLWERLAATEKPIVLYGMGNGAEKIIRALAHYGKRPDGVFASDDFVRGQTFLGYQVKKYSYFAEVYGEFIVLVAFGSQKPDVLANILRIDREQETYAPHVPLFGEGLFDKAYFMAHERELQEVYERLADDASRRVLALLCNYFISGKIAYLMAAVSDEAEDRRLLNLNGEEVYLDLGAYNGDTVREFAAAVGQHYRQILALEPDRKNFRKLLQSTEKMPRFTGINRGVWREKSSLFFASKAGRNSALSPQGTRSVECLTVDDIQQVFAEAPITYIKMDVEGSERQALLGAAATIRRHKPKLLVSAYHRNEDLFSLPRLIWQYDPSYTVYLRHHLYIPGWENNYYCL